MSKFHQQLCWCLVGCILFLISTGFVSNALILLLIPAIFKNTQPIDKSLLALCSILLLSTVLMWPISGFSFRALVLPISLIVSYWLASAINPLAINVFAICILFEVAIACILWLTGTFSPFIAPPFEDWTRGKQESFYYWKTAGLSANASLLALKFIFLVSIKDYLAPSLRRIFPIFYLLIPLTMSRTLILAVAVYTFWHMKVSSKLLVMLTLSLVVGLYSEALWQLLFEQMFRGYQQFAEGNFDSMAEGGNRFNYWIFGFNNFLESPLFGTGGHLTTLNVDGVENKLHSVFFQFASDYGTVGLIGLLFFITKVWKLVQPAAILILAWMAMNNSYMAIFGVADLLLFYVMHNSAKVIIDDNTRGGQVFRSYDRKGVP